jgi:hypothetical protein
MYVSQKKEYSSTVICRGFPFVRAYESHSTFPKPASARYALAVDVMRLKRIREVYSFDENFDRIEGVAELPTL